MMWMNNDSNSQIFLSWFDFFYLKLDIYHFYIGSTIKYWYVFVFNLYLNEKIFPTCFSTETLREMKNHWSSKCFANFLFSFKLDYNLCIKSSFYIMRYPFTFHFSFYQYYVWSFFILHVKGLCEANNRAKNVFSSSPSEFHRFAGEYNVSLSNKVDILTRHIREIG